MTEIQQYNQLTIDKFLEVKEIKKQIAVALGKKFDSEKYIRGVLTTIITNNGNLKSCSNISILRAILTSAQLGLEVDAKQHAYLVPFFNKNNKTYYAQVIPGYRGYLYKMRASNLVKSIVVENVYQDEKIVVKKGLNRDIEHEALIYSDKYGKDDFITHVYCIIEYNNGGYEFEIMTREEIDKIKKFVEDKNKRPSQFWTNHYGEMARKTVIRRIEKRLQLPDNCINQMTVIDNAIDSGQKAYIENGEVVIEHELDKEQYVEEEITEEKKSLIEKIGQKFTDLKLNNAKITEYVAKYLHVSIPAKAKTDNLKNLYNVLCGAK